MSSAAIFVWRFKADPLISYMSDGYSLKGADDVIVSDYFCVVFTHMMSWVLGLNCVSS